MDEKLNGRHNASNLDLSALVEPNEFDRFLNSFIGWVNADISGKDSPRVKALWVSERSWEMLRPTINRAGCAASPGLWKHTIVCPLYLFTTDQTGVHATAQQRAESLRNLLPVAEQRVIDALAQFDSVFFVQALKEFRKTSIPISSLVFLCLSLLEDWHGIGGALTPSAREWWNGYATTRP